jgi:subtilisin family serine protease
MTRITSLCIRTLCTISIISLIAISQLSAQDPNVIWSEDFNGEDGSNLGTFGWSTDTPAGTDPLWEWKLNGAANIGSEWGARTRIATTGGALVFDANRFNGPDPANANSLKETVISREISYAGEDTIILKFNQYYRSYNSVTYVEVRDTSNAEWTRIDVNTGFGKNVETGPDHVKYVDISPFVPDTATIQIRFGFEGDYYFWIVDDVELLRQRPVKTVPDWLSGTLTELGYEFEVDSLGGAYVPNQLVVRYVDTVTIEGRNRVREELNIAKYKECKCNDLVELWYLTEAGDTSINNALNIIDINETTSEAQTKSEVDEVDYNHINFNDLEDHPALNSAPSFASYPASDTDVIKIVIMDTGIDYTNNELKKHIWKADGYGDLCPDIPYPSIGWDFVDNDEFPMDFHSHGTHVAGIVMDNLSSCICPYKLVAARTHDENGAATLFDVTCAFYFSIEIEADYINASFGYYGVEDSIMRSSIQDAVDAGIMVITASGNEGFDLAAQRQYPAVYNLGDMLTIGSANASTGIRDDYSNFNPAYVDFYTPGFEIESTVLNNQRQDKTGTSMSAPYATAAAVLIDCNGKGEVKSNLLQCVTDPSGAVKDEVPVLNIGCIPGGITDDTPGNDFPWPTVIIGAVLIAALLYGFRRQIFG